jgi:hypothetical protein
MNNIAARTAALAIALFFTSALAFGASICKPVTVDTEHTLPEAEDDVFAPNQRLALIEDGTVPCVHIETFEAAQCSFRTSAHAGEGMSGNWIQDKRGRRFAQAGQRIHKSGKRNGEYVIAVRPVGNTVACIGASGADATGTSTSTELAGSCVIERMDSAVNVTGLRLENYATRAVCSSDNPHPDGAQQISADPANGVYCYIGRGAGLNDVNGTERDSSGIYMTGPERCHVAMSSGFEVVAAKRPAANKGKLIPKSPIRWRPLLQGVAVAN